LQAFEGVIDRITACKDVRTSFRNQRNLKIAMLLIHSMNSATLNNEICVGGLVCYLKQLYYSKHQTNVPYDPSGRGGDLLEAMSQNELLP
jgi:hypothetical protein